MTSILRLALVLPALFVACNAAPTAPAEVVEVVRLRFAVATELATTLDDIVEGSARIVPDPRTNSLVVQTTPERMEGILGLIEQLDVGPK